MKRIILSVLLFGSFSMLFAQDKKTQDLKKIRNYVDAKQLDKAKTEIDAYLQKNPDNPEGLYYKSRVYGSLAADQQFKSLAPDGREIAFEAFKKAVEADKDNKLTLLMVQDQYKGIFDLYTGYYDAAVVSFNTAASSGNKADFEIAMNNFLKAEEVGNYIYSKKWALSEVDTALVLNIGKAALNAGNKEMALKYFKRLADVNIAGTKEGNVGYNLPYQWLALHYKEGGDSASLLKYANMGKQYFPNDDYFDLILLDYYRAKKDYESLFKKYGEIVAKAPDSLSYRFNYANEIFNYVYNSDAGTIVNNKEELLKTVGTELEAAGKLSPDDTNTNWLFGQYYYNAGIDLKEKAIRTKGTKPEDVKSKSELNAQAKEMFNKSIPYAEKALASLESGFKKSEKSRYKSVADLLQRIYTSLAQTDKVKIYQAKYDAADAKFIN